MARAAIVPSSRRRARAAPSAVARRERIGPRTAPTARTDGPALEQALARVAALERELDRAVGDRDAARLDVTDLRVRHVRLSAQLLAIQQERAASAAALPELAAPLERIRSLEERNRALEHDVARLRGAIETLKHVPAVSPRRRDRAPWYRRLWLAIIGKDARAAQWGAPESAP